MRMPTPWSTSLRRLSGKGLRGPYPMGKAGDRQMSVQVSADLIRNVLETVNRVHKIYREHRGEPDVKPPVACPNCGAESTFYACAWGYSNHVAFKCNDCGFKLMQ